MCVWSASSDWLPLASHPHFICVSTDFTYSSTFSHTPWKQTNRQTYTTSNSRRSVSLLYTSGYNYNIAIVDGSMGDRKPNNHNENTMKCPEHNKLNRKRMRQSRQNTSENNLFKTITAVNEFSIFTAGTSVEGLRSENYNKQNKTKKLRTASISFILGF